MFFYLTLNVIPTLILTLYLTLNLDLNFKDEKFFES